MFSIYREDEFGAMESMCREWFSSVFKTGLGNVCVCGAWRDEDGALHFDGQLQSCLRPNDAAERAVQLLALGYEVYATCDSLKSARDGHRSTYSKNGRSESNVFSTNCIVLDIDMHAGLSSLSEFDRYEESGESSLLDALCAMWDAGSLPEPGAVMASGRGYHVYYFLEDPVFSDGRPRRYLRDVSRALDDAYDAALEGFDTRVDRAVQSDAHLVRVPGSPNGAAGAGMVCRPVAGVGTGSRVRLADIDVIDRDASRAEQLARAMAKAQPRQASGDAARYAPFFRATVRRVEELAEMNGMDLGGRRNSAMFAYQNAAYMLHGPDTALDMALALNARLRDPLPAKEIEDSSRSIDAVGGYEISKETLAESFLMLTRDERDALRYDREASPVRLPRSEIPARNARLVEMVASGDMTDAEVGDELGLCACTVCRMVRSFMEGRLRLPDGFEVEETEALRRRMRRHGVSSVPGVVERRTSPKLDIFPNAVCSEHPGDDLRPGDAGGAGTTVRNLMHLALFNSTRNVFDSYGTVFSTNRPVFNILFNNRIYIRPTYQHLWVSFQHIMLDGCLAVENSHSRPAVRRCRDGPATVAFPGWGCSS